MSTLPELSQFTYFHTLRVRWAEVDPQSIVFNGHYMTYADVAITEYWRAINLPYPDGVADSLKVSAGVTALGPAAGVLLPTLLPNEASVTFASCVIGG